MSITPIPYLQFLAQGSILSEFGGPWHCSLSADITRHCLEQRTWWTNNQTSISGLIIGNEPPGDYSMLLQTAILVDLPTFGGDNELSYSWSFLATAVTIEPLQRDHLLLSSSVGNTVYADFISAQDLLSNQTWANASHILHSGTTLLTGEGATRTLDISLSLTISSLPSDYAGLTLRNLQLVLASATHTSSTTTSSATRSEPITSAPPPSSSTLPTDTSSPTVAPIIPGPAVDSWIIACSVVSGILLILLTILAIFLWKRRKRLRRISLSKVKSLKRPDPLLTGDLPLGGIDTTRRDPSVITPFYTSQVPHPITQSKNPPTSASPRRENRKRERHLNSPPSYLESPSSPRVTAEQVDAIPICLTPQQKRSNHRISIS